MLSYRFRLSRVQRAELDCELAGARQAGDLPCGGTGSGLVFFLLYF